MDAGHQYRWHQSQLSPRTAVCRDRTLARPVALAQTSVAARPSRDRVSTFNAAHAAQLTHSHHLGLRSVTMLSLAQPTAPPLSSPTTWSSAAPSLPPMYPSAVPRCECPFPPAIPQWHRCDAGFTAYAPLRDYRVISRSPSTADTADEIPR